MEFFLRSIGVGGDLLEHLDSVTLAFQRPAVLWAGLALLVPVGYFIYRRQCNNLGAVPHKFRVALSVTRIVILAMLIAVLAGPYLKLDHESTKKPIVAVMFDTSQSMQLPAGPFESDEQLVRVAQAAGLEPLAKTPAETPAGTPGESPATAPTQALDEGTRQTLNQIGRSALAQSAFRAANESLLQPLQEAYDLRFYSFARELTPIMFDPADTEGILASPQENVASHIGDAIYQVLDDAAGQPVAGLVLLSDGQNTGGRSPAQAARAAADAHAPIFVTPLGSSRPIQDVSVVDVYTSGLVAVGDTVRVHVTLESRGFDGQPVRIELKDGDELLDSKERVVQSAEQQQVELTFEAKHPGPRYLTVTVPHLPEETEQLRSNNSDTAFVRISEEKLKVLLLDGFPRWDFRFIKNAIRRDKGLAGRGQEQPDVVVETEWRRWPDAQKQAALPRTAEEVGKYHAIIIGDVSPELLNADLQNLLIEAVRDHGVGLIVAAGPQSMPHRFPTSFQELLPVRLAPGTAGVEAPVYQPFRLEISPAGVVHEAMRLYDDPVRNLDVWARLPEFFWCAAADRPSAGATVLAWNPSVPGASQKMPLIAHHYAGDGKVLFVGTDSTWLWRQNVGDRYFYKFWGQSLRFVARRDESSGRKSWLEVRPVRARPGEVAEIELMAFKADGSPEDASTQMLTLLGPGWRETLDLAADKQKQGRYMGKFTPQSPGVHRFVYQPSDGGSTAEASLRVLNAPEEFRHPNLNRPVMELLAASSGGSVVEITDLATLPDRLKGEAEHQQLHLEATVWDNWFTLLILVTVYSTDVAIRRLVGLS